MPRSTIKDLYQRLRKRLGQIWYSFPVQLLALQVRQNHLLLALWMLLALFIGNHLASKFGVQYLFLEPEYKGEVGFASFFLLGIGLGGLVMTWNLTTYLLTARYFPFLATLERPFSKYCINNSLLPIGFFLYYAWQLRDFLQAELNFGNGQLFAVLSSLAFGVAVVIVAYVVYFRFTNKDIASYPALKDLIRGRTSRRRFMPPGYRKMDVERIISGETAWRVDTYLTEKIQPRITRSIAHYSPHHILRIFRQNHLNALVLQTFLLIVLMGIGFGIDYDWIRIPAGASIFILFSVIAAFAGAITYWFHSWRTTIFILLLVSINMVTGRDWFSFRNKAYGMDYSATLPVYQYDRLVEIAAPDNVATDRDSMRIILDRWKARTGEEKPRMVLLCVSGGGLKATFWTTNVLQEAQRATQGKMFAHTSLISGASGGMIGAAYFREVQLGKRLEAMDLLGLGSSVLSLRQNLSQTPAAVNTSLAGADDESPAGLRESKKEEKLKIGADFPEEGLFEGQVLTTVLEDSIHLQNVGKDLLNSVAFSIVSKDLFLPSGSFEYEGQSYQKDRGYAFEQQLHENLDGRLNKSIGDYEAAERSATIPMLLLTPSIVNDARRLVISPLGVSHLTLPPVAVGRTTEFEVDAVDFGALFKDFRPERLSFSTALRMNATYPYVLPNVYLPSNPPVEVMDAGFRDNFGVLEASRFLQVYREWILENTSGVALVQVSTLEKFEGVQEHEPKGWIESFFNPLGVAGQLMSLQDFQTDETVGLLYDLLGEDNFDFIRFSYRPGQDRNAASMTFHLTQGEKKDIRESINHPDNVLAMEKLKRSLAHE
ncbi:MAG: hypothetical protein AB8F78_12385 [Saprospiraceae bacterium]